MAICGSFWQFDFTKKKSFCERILLTPIMSVKNTPNRFFDFFLVLAHFALFNILELYDQNPWRNNWSKLATFDPILQRPHSAMNEPSQSLKRSWRTTSHEFILILIKTSKGLLFLPFFLLLRMRRDWKSNDRTSGRILRPFVAPLPR